MRNTFLKDLPLFLIPLALGIGFVAFPQSQVQVGYIVLAADSGTRIPVATALFTYTNPSGVLVSQAGVGAVEPISSGRIFVDQDGTETGIALVNPSSQPASISLILRDSSGKEISRKSISLDPGNHLARFASELFSGLASAFTGSLTFESSQKLAAITLRQSTNASGEVLYTTLPVADLAQAPTAKPLIFPQIAAGDGYTTQIILINRTGDNLRGLVTLYSDDGSRLPLTLSENETSQFPCDLAPHGTYRVELARTGEVRAGYAVVTPDAGSVAPSGSAVFRYSKQNTVITEAGVGAAEPTASARIFVDNSATSTGVALANTEDQAATVTFALLDRNGNPLETTTRTLSSKGHLAVFAHQLFPGMGSQFTGLMEITSTTPLAPITLKLTINQRGDLVYTTLPVADLNKLPSSSLMILPQMASGGGFSTRLIFINPDKAKPAGGKLSFFRPDGSPMVIPFGNLSGNQFPYHAAPGGGLQVFPGSTARIAGIVLVDPSKNVRTSEIAVNEGKTVRASLAVFDETGTVRDDFILNYTSINPAVATVDGNGYIAGKKAGFSTLTISSGGMVVTGTITVVGVQVGVAGYNATGLIQDLAKRIYMALSEDNAILLAPELGQVPEMYAGVRGTAGFRNDVRLSSLFRKPGFLVLDQAKATLYVSDAANHVIRKVEAGPAGKVGTLAGTGSAGYKDGALDASLLNNPQGVALDSRGFLWVVDSGNHVVRKINLAKATVETIAGKAGNPGSADGKGEGARFSSPIGIAIETDAVMPPSFLQSSAPPPAVTVLVTDTGNGVIRRVHDDGQVETIGSNPSTSMLAAQAGPGQSAPISFTNPVGIAVDPLGNIFISEPAQDRVQVILPSNMQLVPAVQPYTFQNPRALAIAQNGKVLIGARNRSGNEITYGEPVISSIEPSSVPMQGGDEVTIKGSNFSSETVVIVMGNKVESLKVQDTQTISFRSPALPSGLTTVSVQNRGGLAQSSLLVYPPQLASLPNGYVTTVAGGTTYNDEGAAAIGASIGVSYGITLDAKGNVYITDEENAQVRRIDALTGVITTVAGMIGPGTEGDGGLATATFVDPNGIAFDSTGNMFLSERLGCRIRRVDAATGIITTVAGKSDWEHCPSGCYYGDGIPAKDALLYGPQGLWVDAANNLYIADSWNQRIRRVDAITGIITTLAGNGQRGYGGDGGPARDASLNDPSSVALDSSGNVYISDTFNNRIRKIEAATQRITTVAGTGEAAFGGDDGPARLAALNGPQQLSFDAAGNLYVVDWMNNRIRKISTSGLISTVAGDGVWGFGGDGGPAIKAQLRSPFGVTVDGSGQIFIVDTVNNRIRLVDRSGRIRSLAGTGRRKYQGDNGLAWAAALASPHAITLDRDGNLFIADEGNRLIRRVDSVTGIMTTAAGSGTNGERGDDGPAALAEFYYPRGVAVDTLGNMFIADTFNNRIRKVDATSGIITTVAGNGNDSGVADGVPAIQSAVVEPWGVTLDNTGSLLIAEAGSHRIRKVDRWSGIITTLAGTGKPGFSGDTGPATAASLNEPACVAVDAQGNIFIADSQNNRIRQVNRNGIIMTVAGNGKESKDGEGGPATAASLGQPMFVIVDSSGSLYISCASLFDERIVRVDAATKILTRIAGGEPAFGAEGDGGPASGAKFWTPIGLALDAAGNLLIADETNDRIRAIKGISQRGNLQIAFDPNPAPRSTDGKWHYSVSLREIGGFAVSLTDFTIDGNPYGDRVVQWFGSNRIQANGQLSGTFATSGNSSQAFNLVWEFAGNDEKGNTGMRWSSILRCLP